MQGECKEATRVLKEELVHKAAQQTVELFGYGSWSKYTGLRKVMCSQLLVGRCHCRFSRN